MNTLKTIGIFFLAILIILIGGYLTFVSKIMTSYIIGLIIIVIGAYGIYHRMVKDNNLMSVICFGFVTLAIIFAVTIFKMILK